MRKVKRIILHWHCFNALEYYFTEIILVIAVFFIWRMKNIKFFILLSSFLINRDKMLKIKFRLFFANSTLFVCNKQFKTFEYFLLAESLLGEIFFY